MKKTNYNTMRPFFYLIVVVSLQSVCAGNLLAQTIPPQFVPPSPGAYSLGKYGALPVGLYTGIPQIAISLVTLTDNGISIPVSLSYHASGIKVDETASFVGLGWALQAGGVITRTIRGKADYLLSDGSLFPKRSYIDFYNPALWPNKSNFINSHNFESTVNGGTDGEPDEFFFNFNGRSGKFYFAGDGQAVLNRNEGLQIKWRYGSQARREIFTIKDESGTTYEFNKHETTFYSGGEDLQVSAWYLTTVKSITGQQITLEYTSSSHTQLTRSASENIIRISATNTNIVPSINAVYYGINYEETKITKITGDLGRIEFKYSAQPRLDYPSLSGGNRALEEVCLYDSHNEIAKKYRLYTSFFQANNIRKYNGSAPQDFQHLNYRLRLDSVQEIASSGNQSLPPHIFLYHGDNDPATDDKLTLPYRLSPQQDHWGYYNYSSNTHMVPAKTDNAYISMDEWFLEFAGRDNDNEGSNVLVGNGANRDPNEESVMANMLRQIKYPTGGSTDFTFEANDFESNMGGVRVLKVVDNPVQGLAKEAMYSYSGYSYFNPRDHYYSYYQVAYDLNARSSPTQTALNIFGVPYEQGTTNVTVKYYKVSLQPQAILGTGSQVGYSTVTVKTVGNGSETYIYADQSEYPDYTTRDAFNEGSTQELNMVNSMYIAEYIDDTDFPTPGGNSMRKTSGGYGLWPYPEHYSNDWKRGVISSKIVKSENGTIVRRPSPPPAGRKS